MNYGHLIALLVMLAVLAGCAQGQKPEAKSGELLFKSGKYGFSFEYPGGWREAKADLPERWALLGKDNSTILLLVNKPKSNDLLALGRSQAIRDLYDEDMASSLREEDLQKVFEIVKLEKFNGGEWYSYGMKFSDKNIDSLVSGTLCNGSEIMIVLVSSPQSFGIDKDTYTRMLSSFECS